MLDQYQKKFMALVKANSHRHPVYQVFSDFCELTAISFSNAVDKQQFDKREARYLEIIKGYRKEEQKRFAEMVGCVVESLEAGFKDFLGKVFMELDLGSHWKGQFFTPYHISSLMAQFSISGWEEMIEKQGYMTLCEPAAGAGVMVIAMAEALLSKKINYQEKLHVTATDIDLTACHMAYIQLSLLHVPAVVIHGNSLSQEKWSYFVTPAHVIGFWDVRLFLAERNHHKEVPTPEPETEKTPKEELQIQRFEVTKKRSEMLYKETIEQLNLF